MRSSSALAAAMPPQPRHSLGPGTQLGGGLGTAQQQDGYQAQRLLADPEVFVEHLAVTGRRPARDG